MCCIIILIVLIVQYEPTGTWVWYIRNCEAVFIAILTESRISYQAWDTPAPIYYIAATQSAAGAGGTAGAAGAGAGGGAAAIPTTAAAAARVGRFVHSSSHGHYCMYNVHYSILVLFLVFASCSTFCTAVLLLIEL